MQINEKYLRNLQFVGTLEAFSTIALFFVAMPLKYWADMPLAVTIVGSLHGGLFVWLVVLYNNGIRKVPYSVRFALWGVVAALVPFGPFFVNHKLDQIAEHDD